MTTFGPDRARCAVFTFKEGLLSAIAHDLEIAVRTFELEVADDGSSIVARFDPRSLEVVDAIVDGRRSPGTLKPKDKETIRGNIAKDVLRVARHPSMIEFRSTEVTPSQVRGELTLVGRTRSIVVRIHEEGDERIAEATLHQPDFGITPYSAMLGTLKIKPDVKVVVRAPKA
ncbi:MAG: YceI family protein [Sandaracinaceae bacterium]